MGILNAAELLAGGFEGALAQRPPVGTFSSIGDSIPAGGYDGSGFPNRISYEGRYRHVAGFAAGGKRSDQILAEQVQLAIASGARICLVEAGTNDIEQSVSEATHRANIISIYAALTGGGVVPINVGLLPRNSNPGFVTARANHELWRQLYCLRNNIPYVCVWPFLANADGTWKTGLNHDTVHPNRLAAKIIGDKASDQMDRLGAQTPFLELIDRPAGVSNVLANAVSFGGPGAALPSGWFGTGLDFSVLAPDANDFGGWLRGTATGAVTLQGFNGTARSLTDLGISIGDKIAVGFRMRWASTSNTAISVRSSLTGISASPDLLILLNEVGASGNDVASIYAYKEFTVTSGTVLGLNFLLTTSGAGYMEVSRPIIYNLTANGLA